MAPGILMGASCTSQAANALGERPSLDPSWERQEGLEKVKESHGWTQPGHCHREIPKERG